MQEVIGILGNVMLSTHQEAGLDFCWHQHDVAYVSSTIFWKSYHCALSLVPACVLDVVVADEIANSLTSVSVCIQPTGIGAWLSFQLQITTKGILLQPNLVHACMCCSQSVIQPMHAVTSMMWVYQGIRTVANMPTSSWVLLLLQE